MEADFEKKIKDEPAVKNMAQFTDPLSQSPYDFMDAAFNGNGGFKTGSYLVPHTREQFYDTRRKSSYYKNFTRPVVRAMVDPVFNKPVSRSISHEGGSSYDTALFWGFIEDANNNGMSLQRLTRQAVLKARLHGVCFVVMDNFESEEQPPVVSDARKDRIFPYAYIRTAQSVRDYRVDKWGNIVSITFEEAPALVVTESGKAEREHRYRVWTQNTVELKAVDKDGKSDRTIEYYEHDLGRTPVVAVYSEERDDLDSLLVDPPLYDIARINWAIYNLDSEIRDLERTQGFCLFYMQADDYGESVTMGPQNLLIVPTSSTIPPGVLAPNPQVLKGLVENNKSMVEHLYRIAEQNGVIGVQPSVSGISKQWSFMALETVLLMTSSMATDLEDKLAALFSLYTGEDFVYAVDYPGDFQPHSVGDLVTVYIDILEKVAKSPAFRKKIEEKAARLVLADEEDVIITDIVDDINRQAD